MTASEIGYYRCTDATVLYNLGDVYWFRDGPPEEGSWQNDSMDFGDVDPQLMAVGYGANMVAPHLKKPPYQPKGFHSREYEKTALPWDPGATKETVTHTYKDGTLISIQRYHGANGFVSVSAARLLPDGAYAELLHQFNNMEI